LINPRVCAVSYLNTVPLVWGMLHGAQRTLFNIKFRLPSGCADALERGEADIGIVPAIEVDRLGLNVIPGVGIACRGAVRSILLFSKKPLGEVRTLAADTSSRSSVALSQVILKRRYGTSPALIPCAPDVEVMLRTADAAVIIGDPALRAEPEALPYTCLDLGAEWKELTGLPMVFAVWACRPEMDAAALAPAFLESWRLGMQNLDEIVRREAPKRNIPAKLAREYLERNVVFEIKERERDGMRLFVEYARAAREAGAGA
jgi:chorismate dehydratase